MFCRYCGKSLDADSNFCGGCGKAVAERSTTEPVSVPPAAAAPANDRAASSSHASSSPQAIKRRRPAGIIVISLLSVISGLISIAGGLLFVFGGYTIGFISANPMVHLAGMFVPVIEQTRSAWIQDATTEGFVVLLLGMGYLFIAVNLFRLKDLQGRILGMVFSAIVALHSAALISSGEGSVTWHVIAIGFNAWVIYYLCKAPIRRAFAPDSVAAVPRVS